MGSREVPICSDCGKPDWPWEGCECPPGAAELRHVALWLCHQCLSGAGGECHVPGCALWLNRAPDLPLEDKVTDLRQHDQYVREMETENRELRRTLTHLQVWEGEGVTLRQHDAEVVARTLEDAGVVQWWTVIGHPAWPGCAPDYRRREDAEDMLAKSPHPDAYVAHRYVSKWQRAETMS